MDDGGVARLCAAALAAVSDARAELLAAADVEWQGSAAERYGDVVEDLLGALVRVTRRLEHARALAAVAAEASAAAAGAGGAAAAGAGGAAAAGAGGTAWAG